jgi:hypothetical protein
MAQCSGSIDELKKNTQIFIGKLRNFAEKGDKMAKIFKIVFSTDTYYPLHIQNFL